LAISPKRKRRGIVKRKRPPKSGGKENILTRDQQQHRTLIGEIRLCGHAERGRGVEEK